MVARKHERLGGTAEEQLPIAVPRVAENVEGALGHLDAASRLEQFVVGGVRPCAGGYKLGVFRHLLRHGGC